MAPFERWSASIQPPLKLTPLSVSSVWCTMTVTSIERQKLSGQVTALLADKIVRDVRHVGEQLPSEREMMRQLGVGRPAPPGICWNSPGGSGTFRRRAPSSRPAWRASRPATPRKSRLKSSRSAYPPTPSMHWRSPTTLIWPGGWSPGLGRAYNRRFEGDRVRGHPEVKRLRSEAKKKRLRNRKRRFPTMGGIREGAQESRGESLVRVIPGCRATPRRRCVNP